MKTIPLTKGKFALVDDEDYDKLTKFPWCISGSGKYAVRRKNGKVVYMHREILAASKGKSIDHANGNQLDNRRSNLRFASISENNWNSNHKAGLSGFRGVSWMRLAKKWQAYIHIKNKKLHLGYFHDKKAAALAHDKAARSLHGEFARLNFSNFSPVLV